jgi:hypothetical protein
MRPHALSVLREHFARDLLARDPGRQELAAELVASIVFDG